MLSNCPVKALFIQHIFQDSWNILRCQIFKNSVIQIIERKPSQIGRWEVGAGACRTLCYAVDCGLPGENRFIFKVSFCFLSTMPLFCLHPNLGSCVLLGYCRSFYMFFLLHPPCSLPSNSSWPSTQKHTVVTGFPPEITLPCFEDVLTFSFISIWNVYRSATHRSWLVTEFSLAHSKMIKIQKMCLEQGVQISKN